MRCFVRCLGISLHLLPRLCWLGLWLRGLIIKQRKPVEQVWIALQSGTVFTEINDAITLAVDLLKNLLEFHFVGFDAGVDQTAPVRKDFGEVRLKLFEVYVPVALLVH